MVHYNEQAKVGISRVESLNGTTLPQERERYTPANDEEKTLDRKINLKLDTILIPLLAIGFLLQGIDKSNIGSAATSPAFIKDAHLKPDDVSNSVSLFSATFVTLMPFSVAAGRYFGAKYWLPFIMISWGAITMGQSAMKNSQTLLALRLLLGAFEAAYVQLSYYYIGTLYPRYMAGFRIGLFAGMSLVAAAFSSLMAYGILQIKSSKYAGWQILFLLEGGVTLAVAIAILFVLPMGLSSAWMLNEREKQHAVARVRADSIETFDEHGNYVEEHHKITMQNVKDAVTDWKKLIIIVCNLCATVPVYGFGIFLPLIVQGMGFHGVRANLMSVSPFLVGTVGLYTIVYLSDHYRDRSAFIALAELIAIVGFIVLIGSDQSSNALRYGFLHVALIGAGTANPLVAAWLLDNTPNSGTRAIVMGLFGWGNVSGVIAGQIYKPKYAPTYKFPLTITLIIVSIGFIGFVAVRGVFMFENRRRIKLMSVWTAEDFEHERTTKERRDDRKKNFLYDY